MDEENILHDFMPVSEYLKGLNIFEVRNLARAFGINSPTSKVKDVLIDGIIRIGAGIDPPERRSNKGARVKASDVSAERLEEVRRLLAECAQRRAYRFQESEASHIEFRDSTPAAAVRGYSDRNQAGIVECVAGGAYLRALDGSASDADPFVSEKTVRKYRLREGDLAGGTVVCENGRAELTEVLTVNGGQPLFIDRPKFDEFPALYPEGTLSLGAGGNAVLRAFDRLCPIGKGQRVILYAPSDSGKTAFVRAAADGLHACMPEAELCFLLPAWRPEEETALREHFPLAPVTACAYGKQSAALRRSVRLIAEHAKRVAESGGDAVLFIDSLAALARVCGEDGVRECEAIFSSGRRLRTGSLTVFAFAPEENADGSLGPCGEAANAVVRFSAEIAARGIVPAVDFSRSHVKNRQASENAAQLRRVLEEEGLGAIFAENRNNQ